MTNLVPMLLQAVQAMILDKAQTLVAAHVEKAIDDCFSEEAKKQLDELIDQDPSHGAKNLQDFLKL